RMHKPTNTIPEYVLRYRFTIALPDDQPQDRWKNRSDSGQGRYWDENTTLYTQNTRRARLLVWPGEFGPTTTERAFVFYTEFVIGGR
ncbi:MAG: hypothetical protein U1E27_07785, partial [Kiritimatiellia bacterium]|nr:hypothetical protein [Kiritimatiellia bacterium]